MGYVLEKISLQDQKKIFSDISHDERNVRNLQRRGGHFANKPNLNWAINREDNSYLFLAPKVDIKSRRHDYYFFFKGFTYQVRLQSRISEQVEVNRYPSDVDKTILESELIRAFEVYGFWGRGPDLENGLTVTLKEV